ncbi:hypothetical protein NQ317_003943 [Molorchus minor]|uniref:Uncharacterized protein n=1 Tax=Molorchus minor TaxID=1323400 RepID=A0ABQ9JEK7_9CUCU|nr:hypothetical protein NQ317_003943 [Molorchus minor]
MLKNVEEDGLRIQEETNSDDYEECLLLAVNRLMEFLQSSTDAIILTQYFSITFEMAAFLIQLITFIRQLRPHLRYTQHPLHCLLPLCGVYVHPSFEINYTYLFQSTAVSDVIFNEVDWVEYPKIRKPLLLMMRRSQKKMSFRAAGIGDMSMETFTKVQNIIGS